MSINMNGQPVIQLHTPLSTQVTNVANVNYVNSQTETKGVNALQGYPEVIANFQTEITSLETQAAKLVKLDGSSTLSGDITCPSISGLETPQDTQLTNVANVSYIKDSMDRVVVNQVNDNTNAISSADNKITSLETQATKLMKLDGSSTLSGDITCPSISGLETPQDTQLTNVANVNYVNQSISKLNSTFLSETPCVSYLLGSMDQTVLSNHSCSFDNTNMSFKSTNFDEYISVGVEDVTFSKPGAFYIYIYLGEVTANASIVDKFNLFLTYSYNSTHYLLSGFYYTEYLSSYVITSSFVIQENNIIGGSAPVVIRMLVSGGDSSSYMKITKMQWFIVKLNTFYS